MKKQKSIEVITNFKKKSNIKPIHFRISLDDESFNYVSKDKILTVTKESSENNQGMLYNCQTLIDGELSFYNLKFELSSNKWKLWKM